MYLHGGVKYRYLQRLLTPLTQPRCLAAVAELHR